MKSFKFLLILFSTALCAVQTTWAWDSKRLENIVIDGIKASIVVGASRDYMPRKNENGSGLMVGYTIMSLDKESKLPSNIKVLETTVRNLGETWNMVSSKDKNANVWPSSIGYSIVFRKGPKWDINSYLDISLTIQINQQTYQIDAENVVLGKTN